MLASGMGTVSSIDSLHRSALSTGTAFGAGDLLDAVDDRTRGLLARQRQARRGPLLRRSLVAADLIGLSLAFVLAALMYDDPTVRGRLGSPGEILLFVSMLPAWVVVGKLQGLYDRDEEQPGHTTTDDVVGVFHVVTVGAWVLLAGAYLTHLAHPDFAKLFAFWLLATAITPLFRVLARRICQRSPAFQQNTVIVGAGDVGQLVARKLIKHPEYGVNVVGFVDSHPKARRPDLPEHLGILGGTDRLVEIVERLDVERVVLSFSTEPEPDLVESVRELSGLNVQIDLVPRLYELMSPRVAVHTIEGLPLVGLPPVRVTPSVRRLKRGLDILGASIGLLVTAPLFLYVAVRTRLDSRGPILFRQTRLGLGMREFTALKFRTMKVDTDNTVHQAYIKDIMSSGAEIGANGIYKLDRSDAITPFGHWLRKTSLDELPQLWNVLRGDMSLVGPRPCIPYEVEHFRPHQLERFLVPQGITGLWQVTARANSTFGEALDMDVAYVRGWTLGLDLRLLLRTPFALLRQRNATA
jgi:exopolysaccharide biosynthesis polyprenyl glycosylphosphotransferase